MYSLIRSQTSEVEGDTGEMLQNILGARMKWGQAQSVQETLMLYEVRGSREARPMFDHLKHVWERAQSVQENQVLHKLRES